MAAYSRRLSPNQHTLTLRAQVRSHDVILRFIDFMLCISFEFFVVVVVVFHSFNVVILEYLRLGYLLRIFSIDISLNPVHHG